MLVETTIAEMPAPPPPPAVAKRAGLRYVNDSRPGIRRRTAGGSFAYVDSDGETIRDPETLDRIRTLAIPPAWRDVWICPFPTGHLQATGIDARGRKQYRYHRRWREVRDETKYDRMIAFAAALPAIRAEVERDLARQGLPREKVLATIVRLLETTLIRIGNREYARENDSYGLTTLRNRHVKVAGDTLHFEFRAKSGKIRKLDLRHRRIARIVKSCRDLPGYELFQYIDDGGERHSLSSEDVNAYLKEAAGADFTAKDFRTWFGTVLAATALKELGAFDSDAAAKSNIAQAVASVAARLGNTASICRKCYIHPEIFAAYVEGALADGLKSDVKAASIENIERLSQEEREALAFLQMRLDTEAKAAETSR